MTDNARAVFQAHAGSYADDLRRRLIPPFDAFYGTAVGALGAAGEVRRVLDLGAGTGLLSGMVAAARPGVALTLVDGAPAMLDQARERLAGVADATFVVGDLRDPLPDASGAGAAGGGAGATGADGWDAVVSALAIHHLDDAGKRDLFTRVHAALRPGGVFVNAEQVLGRTPAIQAGYRAWHRASSAALGTTPEEWAASEERMAHDVWAPVGDQIAWLEAAGFPDADAPFRDHCFAVLVARKPG
ncbi:class I SAM-dependent methyltransferase [Conexibacter stalactiti]|uniref:Class I SAM-dependent methyltransferase n=1 Tax=Conexibacter stalactiti TaxID=1940611 RepID=A0ABU4HQB9_9ACTN|nr:class I SAM-dependent methyltransferase [Conexibacter stalactiti]MDW5595523.1 class I SAM-dependent methyltransferase [Conexibacter stalactiti]MEC5036165.1 class I SAM-dependent methyltransferase [Conexibacter stalactiti]